MKSRDPFKKHAIAMFSNICKTEQEFLDVIKVQRELTREQVQDQLKEFRLAKQDLQKYLDALPKDENGEQIAKQCNGTVHFGLTE